jgi:hypothetical protein
MTMPEPSAKAPPRELQKTLLRMRLEMHRQELRHETLVMLQPLRKAQHWRKHWREELSNSSAPLWVAGSAVLLATIGIRSGHWRRWVRIALIVFPLLRRHPPRRPDTSTDASKDTQTGL